MAARTPVFAAAVLLAMTISMNTNAQVTLREDNIDQVLAELTLKEKATLVVGAGWKSMLSGTVNLVGGVPVPGAAGMTRPVARLGIPAIVLSDGPAGVRIAPVRKGEKGRTYFCTGFPTGTLLSSTWNADMVRAVGAAIGEEARDYGIDVMLAPGMNIHRNPLCGRNFEYFSEDPVLSGRIAAAYVDGVQSRGVGTSVKHFAANNQETNRFWNDARVSEEALRGLYLRNFEIVIKESRPWTVMSSYNRLNGTHTQQDRRLLTEILRDEWGFEGLVMTDWTGKRDTPAQISAGNDLMEPGLDTQVNELVRSVRKGELDEALLDVCVRRVLELIVKTNTFKGHVPSNEPDLEAHAGVAREAAAEGIILLKNESGALPLAPGLRLALFGNASYSLLAGGTGSGHVNRPYVVDIEDGLDDAGYEFDAALAGTYHKHISDNLPRVTASTRMLGSPAAPEMPLARALVEASVSACDAALVAIGRQAGEGGDRHLEGDFLLTDAEKRMIADVCEVYHASGKKVIVVLNVGGVVETASWKELPDAILLAWQPGEEGGHAIADILSGAVNPSGRLPVTLPVDYFDIPSSRNFPYDYKGRGSMGAGNEKAGAGVPNVGYTDYAEGLDVGYRYFLHSGVPVSYPFGFGLSYPTFVQSEPEFLSEKDGEVTARVSVTNTGTVPGKDVVMIMNPWLEAFAKTKLLQPGETETVVLKYHRYE